MMELVALSTVGLTAYNMLAQHGGSLSAAEVQAFASAQGFTYPEERVVKALTALRVRGRVAEKDGTFRALGPAGVVCHLRDASGDGWSGWRLRRLDRPPAHRVAVRSDYPLLDERLETP